jgi:RNA polymerase sigma-70 factor (ECF subfamily)
MASSLAWTLPAPWPVPVPSPPSQMTTADASLADLDEQALVEACVSGRPGAFDIIVERHRRPVYQLCYRFVNNHEDASDLSQDVFLRAYRGLRRFRGQSSLATWLYRIGVNVCLSRVSAKSPLGSPGRAIESIDDEHLVDERTESAPDRMLRHERSARVRDAISQLPRKQRAALVMRMYHEMSHQEIAEVLGSSVGAVKANFFHALGNLKKLLGEEI